MAGSVDIGSREENAPKQNFGTGRIRPLARAKRATEQRNANVVNGIDGTGIRV
jgi:hypothetical protein